MGAEVLDSNVVTLDPRVESSDPFEFVLDVTRKYGDAVQYTGPLGKTYLFNHPKYIKPVLQSAQFQRTSMVKIVLGEGILSSDGDYWRKQRRLATPFFNRDALDNIKPIIVARTHELLDRWSLVCESGESLDVSIEMTQLTLEIIVDSLFGVRPHSGLQELGKSLDVLLNDLGDMGCTAFNAPLVFSASDRERFQTALSTLDRIVAEIIEQRRGTEADPGNFLSHLLTARDADSGELLTDRQIRDEVVTMLIAGHETTALILSWAWHLLVENPHVENRLHEELDRELGSELPNFDDLGRLPYALMILRESMRLYPPVWSIARKSMYSGEIGGCFVPENVLVIVSPYAIHRHNEFWQDPLCFEPLRFSGSADHDKFVYIPFGGGHHLCLGMNLALLEGHFILAAIAKKFRIQTVDGHCTEKQAAVTLRLRNGLIAILSERSNLSDTE